MELQITAPAPVVINSVESATGTHQLEENANLEIRTATIVQPQVGALYTEKLIVSESASYAPPGLKGDPGIHVGTTPPADLDTLWVKI